MHLGASQALKGTLCFLCTSGSTDSVLLPNPPSHLSSLEQSRWCKCWCWAVDRDNRGTTCPHPSLMRQLMNGTSLLMLLQGRCLGNETKTNALFLRVCTMSPSLWIPVFLAVWADSEEELSTLYSSRPPSCALTWVSFYGRGMKSVMCILTGCCFVSIFIRLGHEVKSRHSDTPSQPGNFLALKRKDATISASMRQSPESQ